MNMRKLTLTFALLGTLMIVGQAHADVGTFKFFNSSKGFGFIAPVDGGPDIFVHISAVQRSGMTRLVEGQKVEYDVERGQHGKVSATNLRPA